MKKSKIFIGAATVVLVITTYFSAIANYKKFATFSTAVTAAGNVRIIGLNIFTTIAAHGNQVFLLMEERRSGIFSQR
ncbi:MAG: hypothetical protein BGO55_08670 [Sphingobacteriales bacterium 50-39]|nr:hypothetical protein [Sphingobacteriales bacterium]OJW59335.1 MAG: hypothetical protein BGO55_08670 [Sphingobacteriales bacterium 50-39]